MADRKEAVITDHAYKKLKKRTGLNKTTFDLLVNEALTDGISCYKFKGRLRSYLNSLMIREKKAKNIRIYKNYVFIFNGHVLATMYPLTGRFQKTANEQIKRIKKEK